MKLPMVATILALTFSPVSAMAADQPLVWQLVGTSPDVYAPSYPQPSQPNYFDHASLPIRAFLRARIGMSFAALRAAERCEQAAQLPDKRAAVLSTGIVHCSHRMR